MTWIPVTGLVPQYEKNEGEPAKKYFIKFFAYGTNIAIDMATDRSGDILMDKCMINNFGYPVIEPDPVTGTIFVPHIDQGYRLGLFPTASDADNNTNGIWPNIDPNTLALSSASSSKMLATVDEMIADMSAAIGDYYTISDYDTGLKSGVMYLEVVAGGTGEADNGEYFDHSSLDVQFRQNLPSPINLKRFGLKGDGSDESSQFQRLLDIANDILIDEGSTFYFGSQVIRSVGNLNIRGTNGRTSILSYGATDDSALFLIKNDGSIVPSITFKNFSVTGMDEATGGAFELEDISTVLFEDIYIEDFSADPINSFGIKMRGREFIRINRFTAKHVITPIIFLDNPGASTLDNDIVHLSDLNLNVSDNVNGIGIDFRGNTNSSIVIDGQNSIAVCHHGIRVQTSTGEVPPPEDDVKLIYPDSFDLKISGLRVEQSDSAFARGVLSLTDNAVENDEVVIGGTTYIFVLRDNLPDQDDDGDDIVYVPIGDSSRCSIELLQAAINQTVLEADENDDDSCGEFKNIAKAQKEGVTAQILDSTADTHSLGVGGGSEVDAQGEAIITTTSIANGFWAEGTLKPQKDTGYGIYLDQASDSAFQNVILENIRISNDNNGYYLRNAKRVNINNCSIGGAYGHNSINVDDSIDFLAFNQFYRPPASQQIIVGLSDFKIETAESNVEYWSKRDTINLSSKKGITFASSLNLLSAGTVIPILDGNYTANVNEVVSGGGYMIALPFPEGVHGHGTIMAVGGDGAVKAHGHFYFDKNGTTTVLNDNLNTFNVYNNELTINIYQVGERIRVRNNLNETVRITVSGMYFNSALS